MGIGLEALTEHQLKDNLFGSVLPSQLLQQLTTRAQGGESCPDDFISPKSKSLQTWQNQEEKAPGLLQQAQDKNGFAPVGSRVTWQENSTAFVVVYRSQDRG